MFVQADLDAEFGIVTVVAVLLIMCCLLHLAQFCFIML